jgi:hypothetical protein
MVEEEKNADIRPGISQEQKVGLFLLFVFAILAVGLGVLQMRNTLYGPFALKNVTPNISADEVNTVEAQQLRDTDHDGLNDFDELYIYSTSIYLADSDSDGLTDKQEVDSGKNPLCPEGQQCGGIADENTDAERGASSSLKILGIDTSEDLGPEPMDLNAALQDPIQIKKMLVEAGVSADLLKGVSDTELMSMVNEIMAVSSTANVETLNALNSLSSLSNLATSTTKSTPTKK